MGGRGKYGWLAAGCAAAWLCGAVPAEAQIATGGSGSTSGSTKGTAPAGKPGAAQRPADYRSQHFFLHTDLTPAETKDLLTRLETMLGLISKYWGRPPVGIIECYVVKDLRNWEGAALDPAGLASIESGGGVTISNGFSKGDQVVLRSVVYATADHGTPQHEAVHAYCAQAFGRTGPVWYSEGMAEMGQYWKDGEKAVNAHDVVVEYIRKSKPKSLNEIVNGNETTGDSWQNYAWRWALCHLLANNPNYAAQFHPLGMSLLTKKGDLTFENVYGQMADKISFEYLFFLEHMEKGYRVDLCAFDWKRKFARATSSGVSSVCDAGKGWQPTGLMLEDGKEYTVAAAGTWKLSPTGQSLTAAGGDEGKGKLMGVVLKGFEMGEPFPIGGEDSFKAPSDGNLWVRCEDAWGEIADNKGKLNLKFKLK